MYGRLNITFWPTHNFHMRVQLIYCMLVEKTLVSPCPLQKSLLLFFHLYSINGLTSLTHNPGIWSALLSKGHIVNSWTLIFSLISHRAIMMPGSLLKAPVLSSNNGIRFHPGYTPPGMPSLRAFHLRVSCCCCVAGGCSLQPFERHRSTCVFCDSYSVSGNSQMTRPLSEVFFWSCYLYTHKYTYNNEAVLVDCLSELACKRGINQMTWWICS